MHLSLLITWPYTLKSDISVTLDDRVPEYGHPKEFRTCAWGKLPPLFPLHHLPTGNTKLETHPETRVSDLQHFLNTGVEVWSAHLSSLSALVYISSWYAVYKNGYQDGSTDKKRAKEDREPMKNDFRILVQVALLRKITDEIFEWEI